MSGERPNPAANRKIVQGVGKVSLEPVESRRPSIVEKVASARARRRVSTPSKALAEIEKLETLGVAEVGEPVYVWPAARGRVTGHAVGCAEHGAMPFLAPSKRAGILAAARHIKAEHRGAGTVVLRDRAPRIKVEAVAS